MRRRQLKRINEKISALFLVCLISLAITGYTYSHWTDILTIFGNIQTGNLKITIDDQKYISDQTYYPSKTGDNKTLTISAEITQPWQIWVGITIKNKGTVPVTITYTLTASNHIEYEGYFRNETHFYGPYTTIPPEVWDNIDGINPPPAGEQTPPIDLPVDQKLVVWQKIRLEDSPPTAFTINIYSEYFGTLGPWQDWVEVIYYLRVRG
jgi:predicted ribosomally synthesized peptide with SipW-like signal peptide